MAPYTLVELDDGRTMAVISMFDAKYLTALSPHYYNLVLEFEYALIRTITALQRLVDSTSVLHAGRSTGVAPRGPLYGGRSTRAAPRGSLHVGGSQIFFIMTCGQY